MTDREKLGVPEDTPEVVALCWELVDCAQRQVREIERGVVKPSPLEVVSLRTWTACTARCLAVVVGQRRDLTDAGIWQLARRLEFKALKAAGACDRRGELAGRGEEEEPLPMEVDGRVMVVEALSGGWMVLVDGVQWGPVGEERNAAGAASSEWPSEAEARAAYEVEG